MCINDTDLCSAGTAIIAAQLSEPSPNLPTNSAPSQLSMKTTARRTASRTRNAVPGASASTTSSTTILVTYTKPASALMFSPTKDLTITSTISAVLSLLLQTSVAEQETRSVV